MTAIQFGGGGAHDATHGYGQGAGATEADLGSGALGSINFGNMVNWLGAVVSVSLIAGLGYWGYQLMVRDVSGVPVVRALEGPMRVAPLDPGGVLAKNQGLAVNNIAARGEAEAPAERVVLAPRPTVLTPEDQTTGALDALRPEAAQAGLVDRSQNPVATTAGPSDEGPQQVQTASADQVSTPEADQASLIDAALLQAQDTAASITPTPQAEPHDSVVQASAGGPSSSRRPVLRPASIVPDAILSTPVPAVLVVTPDAPVVVSVKPESIPVGTRLVQLGVFENPDLAAEKWLVLAAKFDAPMGDKSRVIERAEAGGQVFFRLRALGFSGLSDARRFCSTLLAGQADCIPLITR